jgi:hypothetical protein
MTPLKTIEKSSTIHSAAHDPASSVLAVRFKDKNGEPAPHVYHYKGVGKEVADKFFSAESAGHFHGSNIKGQYEHEKLDA